MKRIIIALMLALSALSALGGTAAAASAATSAPACSWHCSAAQAWGVTGITWHGAWGHGRATGQATGQYATVHLYTAHGSMTYDNATVTIYHLNGYRTVAYYSWTGGWHYTGGKCLPRPIVGC